MLASQLAMQKLKMEECQFAFIRILQLNLRKKPRCSRKKPKNRAVQIILAQIENRAVQGSRCSRPRCSRPLCIIELHDEIFYFLHMSLLTYQNQLQNHKANLLYSFLFYKHQATMCTQIVLTTLDFLYVFYSTLVRKLTMCDGIIDFRK